ncbi:MAG TPA: adenylate/guanylate cyclase domain-containing protein [Chitinophagales bacterium]|nr:adenylate/guanylate cyclase domain-containing protein [Chitinophagales bacterium]
MELLKRITYYFIPEEFSGDDDEKRRYTFLIWLGLIVGLNYAFSLSMISFFVTLNVFQKSIAAFGTLANLAGPVLLKWRFPRFWVSQLVLLGNIMCFITLNYSMGGVTTTTAIWMCSFPLFALILMDWKQSILWGIISGGIALTYAILEYSGRFTTFNVFGKETPLVSFVMLLFFTATVITLYYVIDQIKNRLVVQLKDEKQKSDTLLLNILPEEVAEELKAKGTANAKLFNDVTVLFTDFKGFTKVSELLSPQELVDELHACFSAFDEICGKYNIEKIKTVGDAYLAVAGLPVPDNNHAQNVVKAAIEISAFMQQRKAEATFGARQAFDVRIGIHSGSVVAGIVGVKKFAYDIWGDAVNTAARMEQNSEPGKINVSEATYNLLCTNSKCKFEYRGEIEAKNKGKLKMYFVKSA